MSTIESPKMICLKSSDGVTFEVEEAVAIKSRTVEHLIEDNCADDVIPLPNVTSKILAKVIEYCKRHLDATAKAEATGATATDKSESEAEIKALNAEFVEVDRVTLFGLIKAADYLNIRSLFDLTCESVADKMKGKTPDQIRSTFNIQNDFTPEEHEEVLSQNAWAFD